MVCKGFIDTDNGKIDIKVGALIYVGSWLWSSLDAYSTAKRKEIERSD